MIKYIGNGSFYQGIPARDLTDDEWKAIGRRKRRKLVELGLYKEAVKQKAKPKLEVIHDNS